MPDARGGVGRQSHADDDVSRVVGGGREARADGRAVVWRSPPDADRLVREQSAGARGDRVARRGGGRRERHGRGRGWPADDEAAGRLGPLGRRQWRVGGRISDPHRRVGRAGQRGEEPRVARDRSIARVVGEDAERVAGVEPLAWLGRQQDRDQVVIRRSLGSRLAQQRAGLAGVEVGIPGRRGERCPRDDEAGDGDQRQRAEPRSR